MCVHNITIWIQLAFTLEVVGPWTTVALKVPSSNPQRPQNQRLRVRRKPPRNSYLYGLKPSWDCWRKSVTWHPTDLQIQFKNTCYNSQAAVISPSSANWLCIAHFVIFPLFTTLGLSVFWTNDNMLYWKTNCLKMELENKLCRATEKGLCASDGSNSRNDIKSASTYRGETPPRVWD